MIKYVSIMVDDKVLERIKSKKLSEMFKRSALAEKLETSRKIRGSTLNKPVKVTDATFKETIQDHSIVVVDCWAPWCAPCKIVAPILQELSKEYNDKLKICKINLVFVL